MQFGVFLVCWHWNELSSMEGKWKWWILVDQSILFTCYYVELSNTIKTTLNHLIKHCAHSVPWNENLSSNSHVLCLPINYLQNRKWHSSLLISLSIQKPWLIKVTFFFYETFLWVVTTRSHFDTTGGVFIHVWHISDVV